MTTTVPTMEWARTFRADRAADLGSVGLRPFAYLRDGAALTSSVPSLVATVDTGERALWHESTGVLGFLNLRPGPRVFQVSHPSGYWLPKEVAVAAPDHATLRTALEQGTTPPNGVWPTWVDVPMYPTVLLPIPSAETVIWGVVSRASQPVPGAFVQLLFSVAAAPTKVWRGATNEAGVYCLWLRGLMPADQADPPAAQTLLAFAPRATSVARLPATFDSLDPTIATFGAAYDPVGSTTHPTVALGTRTRLDLTLP